LPRGNWPGNCTEAALKAAKESGTARKFSDGGGLVLEVRPTGAGW
jgi:hypothetical protein